MVDVEVQAQVLFQQEETVDQVEEVMLMVHHHHLEIWQRVLVTHHQ